MDGHADLYWIPLGAGAHVVRLSGRLFEGAAATISRRPRCDLYHSALVVVLPEGRYTIEMTPVPDAEGERRGVVAEGAVGTRAAGRLRLFRYEVRRWPGGCIPDAAEAVDSPVRVADDVDGRPADPRGAAPGADAGLGSSRAGPRRHVELELGRVLGPGPCGSRHGGAAAADRRARAGLGRRARRGRPSAPRRGRSRGRPPGGGIRCGVAEPIDESERKDLCDCWSSWDRTLRRSAKGGPRPTWPPTSCSASTSTGGATSAWRRRRPRASR